MGVGAQSHQQMALGKLDSYGQRVKLEHCPDHTQNSAQNGSKTGLQDPKSWKQKQAGSFFTSVLASLGKGQENKNKQTGLRQTTKLLPSSKRNPQQPTEWKKISANGFMSTIYK